MAKTADAHHEDPLEQLIRRLEQAVRPKPTDDDNPPAAGEGLPDRIITGRESFDEITDSDQDAEEEPDKARQIAAISYYLALDCLVNLAWRVAHDFFRRPHLYTALQGGDVDVAAKLAKLRARYGTDEAVPSQELRDGFYKSFFNQTAGEVAANPVEAPGDYLRTRNDLLYQVSQYTQRIWDTSEATLAAAVKTSHLPFKQYLETFRGDALAWTRVNALRPIADDTAYPILRAKGVLTVFSIAADINPEWPYVPDARADTAMEQISKQLAKEGETPLTRNTIRDRQRAALRGAEAIATVLDYDQGMPPAALQLLITKCYVWEAALRAQAGMPVAVAVSPGTTTNGGPSLPAIGPPASVRALS